jgi:hypothetical protein
MTISPTGRTGYERSPRLSGETGSNLRMATAETDPAAMTLLSRRRIKPTRDRNGRLGRPFRLRLTSALGDDRGRRLAFAHEATAQAEAGDDKCYCQCNLFHGTPLDLNGS